ncbi:MAG: DnaJ domain-containing protein [Limnohabitans sp.]|nr:DnaJ domain-containing protein [Limnohabitans sp.]
MTDYYKILGLPSNATQDEIRTAYRKLSKKFHPDVNQGDKFFEERFKEIQEAYEKLTNFEFKSNYDRQKQETNTKQNSQQFTQAKNTNNSTTNSTTNRQPKQQTTNKSNNSLFIKIAIGVVIAILIGVLRGSIKKSAIENAKESYRNELNNSNSSTSFTSTDTTTFSTPTNINDLNNSISVDTSIATEPTLENTQFTTSNVFENSSKEEIKNWLLKTLQENSQNRISCPERIGGMYGSCTDYKDYEFKLTDDYLVVNYNYNNDYDETVYIPFYDYKSVYGTDYGSEFSISTNSSTMYEINKSDNSKSTTAYINIGFKNNSETNIIKKIENALSRLQIMSSKPSTSALPVFITNSERNKPSLEETKNWFISKLKAYTASNFQMAISEGTSMDVKNLSLDLYGNDLIIEFNTYSVNYKVKVPLCKASIRQPFRSYGNNMSNQCTIQFSTPIKIIEEYNTYSGMKYTNSIQLKVDLEREENLFDRLKKSLSNIKSYCPQNTSSKETY